MSTHDELFAIVQANPNDETAWGVLQDWLLAHEDPRGQLAAAKPAAVPALLEQLAPQWFGRPVKVEDDVVYMRENLGDAWSPSVQLEFLRGHVCKLTVTTHWDGNGSDWGQGWMHPLLGRILSQPVGQLIQEMEIRATPNSEFFYEGLIESITACAPLTVRKVYCGDNDQLSWTMVPNCTSLWAAAPFLEDVKLEGSAIALGTLDHARLRRLSLVSGGLRVEPVQALVQAKVPALRKLDLWFGSSNYGAECSVDDVVPLLERDFESLVHMGLRNCEFSDVLVPRVLTARWLPRLEELDLGGSILTDQGGEALLAGADALRHLKKLDVSKDFLSTGMVERLTATFGAALVSEPQNSADAYGGELYYFVEVGE